MSTAEQAVADLDAEARQIDDLVGVLPADRWALPTPATGWTVGHQVGHLTFVYGLAGTAAADPGKFAEIGGGVEERGGFDAVVNATAGEHLDEGPAALLTRWQQTRDWAVTALGAASDQATVPWLVNPLPPAVLAAAGMMETFAHGQDIADALGVRIPRTDRMRHIVEFAAHTWAFGYEARGLTPPPAAFRFEILGPSGDVWHAGPDAADAGGLITGSAEDLCLLVTRRRHRDDLDIAAEGTEADAWIDIAQAYRGPAGEGRAPSSARRAG